MLPRTRAVAAPTITMPNLPQVKSEEECVELGLVYSTHTPEQWAVKYTPVSIVGNAGSASPMGDTHDEVGLHSLHTEPDHFSLARTRTRALYVCPSTSKSGSSSAIQFHLHDVVFVFCDFQKITEKQNQNRCSWTGCWSGKFSKYFFTVFFISFFAVFPVFCHRQMSVNDTQKLGFSLHSKAPFKRIHTFHSWSHLFHCSSQLKFPISMCFFTWENQETVVKLMCGFAGGWSFTKQWGNETFGSHLKTNCVGEMTQVFISLTVTRWIEEHRHVWLRVATLQGDVQPVKDLKLSLSWKKKRSSHKSKHQLNYFIFVIIIWQTHISRLVKIQVARSLLRTGLHDTVSGVSTTP